VYFILKHFGKWQVGTAAPDADRNEDGDLMPVETCADIDQLNVNWIGTPVVYTRWGRQLSNARRRRYFHW
jgi:hypothetical protein